MQQSKKPINLTIYRLFITFVFKLVGDAYIALIEAKEVFLPIDENIQLAEKIAKICKDSGNKIEEGKIVEYLASSYGNIPNLDKSLFYLNKSLKIYRQADYEQVQSVYALMGAIYNEFGDFPKAIKYTHMATTLVEKFHDTNKEAAEVYNYAGTVYRSLKQNHLAIEYFKKSLDISKHYSNLGNTAWYEINIIDIQLKVNKKEDVLKYIHDLEMNFDKFNPQIQKHAMACLINSYVKLKDYKSAKKYVDLVSQILPKLNADETWEYIQLYSGMLLYNFRTKNYEESRNYAYKYMAIVRKIKSKEKLIPIYHVLFQVDSAQGNYMSAIKNLKTEQIYKDSLFDETKNKQVAELQIRYKIAKKDKDLLVKDKANLILQKQSNRANFIKNISFSGVIVLLVIAGLLWYNYRIKQRNNILLQKQKEEINQKNATLNTLLSEKEWLIKEIHHRVKNNLQMVMSLLNTQSHYLKDDAAMTAIKNTQHRINSMALIHKKLYQSDNVVAIDMKNYIEELVAYLQESFVTGQRIRFSSEIVAIELDACQAIPLGLILNESITNAIKYAFPDDVNGEIRVSLRCAGENSYVLSISDNGIGILNDYVIKNASTLGMKLIKGLADDIEAKLTIENSNGFTISIAFDYNMKKIFLSDTA